MRRSSGRQGSSDGAGPGGAEPGGAEPGGAAPGGRRPRADRVLDGIGAALVVVLGATALVSLAPAAAGLSMTTPWAQMVTLRAVTGGGALVLAVVLALVAAVVRWRRRPTGGGRRGAGWPRWLLALVACLLVTGLGHGLALLLTAPVPGAAEPAARDGDLVVTAFNVGPSGVAADDVVALALRRGADVLALSETPEPLAQEVADGLARAGRPVQLLSARSRPAAPLELRPTGSLLPFVRPDTHLLVSTGLGAYEPAPAPALLGGAVVAVPADGSGPRLAAVHTLPAVPLLFDVGRWRAETAAVVELCAQLPGGVVAGDLNATPDHAVLRGSACSPATDAGGGVPGTWPAGLAPALAAPIDHVLADEATWEVVGTSVDDAGSDHRALTAVLRPR